MPVSSHVSLKYISPEKLGFDEVQLTNKPQLFRRWKTLSTGYRNWIIR